MSSRIDLLQPLQTIALPQPVSARLAARHPGLAPARCADVTYGLGIVLPLLARNLPFARAPLGLRVPLTAGELQRGHHLLVLERGRPAAYAGWATCTEEQAARFLGEQGIHALDFTLRDGPLMVILTATALSPDAMAALRLTMRALYAGRTYIGRRVGGESRPADLKVPRRGLIRPLAGLS